MRLAESARKVFGVWVVAVCFALLETSGAFASPTPTARSIPRGAIDNDAGRIVLVAIATLTAAHASLNDAMPDLGALEVQPLSNVVARQVLDAVGHDHGLRMLSFWPNPSLGLYCATFEIPNVATRDSVLTALAHDARVSVAQPLQEFAMPGAD